MPPTRGERDRASAARRAHRHHGQRPRGKTLITDGPFLETHEHLGGVYVLDCRDLDEALELAALCPMAAVGTVEVRPVASVPGLSHQA
ncbi:YciI family protein [Amycolatopsis rubida]|uniref:YCII-related domain-containing protein n=1 Tax=Amycolatopsis rubida TaxID=112413 RepID=A0A1I6BG96_9PSEU|nr:YCII-related domain-containing protein [Amycolatopsis rubida]